MDSKEIAAVNSLVAALREIKAVLEAIQGLRQVYEMTDSEWDRCLRLAKQQVGGISWRPITGEQDGRPDSGGHDRGVD